VRFAVLGPLEAVDTEGRPVAVGGSRLRALLAMLALDAGRTVPAETLVDGLWGAEPPDGAANALQSLVSRLRRALGAAAIDSVAGGYRLATARDTVDAHRFGTAASAGRQALAAGDAARAAALLGDALALWRGPALADVRDAPFAAAAADRLEEQRLAAVEDHAEAGLALGRHAAVAAELAEPGARYPLRERLQALRMRALYAGGRQAEALGVWEDTRRALADELGVDPSPELAATHLAVLRADPALTAAAPAAAPAPAPPRTNLRAALTSFVGRDADVDRVRHLLAGARLVTLLGPGGSGKTRLAGESASRLAAAPGAGFADGAWLVELAPVTDPSEVPHAVLSALGIRPDTGMLAERAAATTAGAAAAPPPTGPLDRLTTALADRRMLLVLDNCEHVLDAAAQLAATVLASCPDVRVLATSREALGVTGEVLCPVQPLELPAPDADATAAVRAAAVRLFADRAGAVQPAFAVDDGTVGAVTRICRQLDGMPLAIELAAARLRGLTVEQVAGRLDDRFRLLTAGDRTALPRHQTLRAVVQWSWELLDEPERRLLRRLSVFAGGATLESIEAVCAGPDLPAADILDLLASLREKSLLELSGLDRYRLLETIRAYGDAELAAAGEKDRIRAAHAAHFLELVLAAEPELLGRDQLVWLDRLRAEHDNTLAAIRSSLDARDVRTALRFVGAVCWSWWLRGYRTEGQAWARQVLAVVGDDPPPDLAEAYLICRGSAFEWFPDEETIRDVLATTRDLTGEVPNHPLLLLMTVMLTALGGDMPRALRILDRVIDGGGDSWRVAAARLFRGNLLVNDGELGKATEDYERSRATFAELGERWGMSQALVAASEMAGYQGDYARSSELLEEAGQLAHELGATEERPEILIRLAQLWTKAGEVDRAQAYLEDARQLMDSMDNRFARTILGLVEADIHRRRGDLAMAREVIDTAVAELDTLSPNMPQQFRALVVTQLAMLAMHEGDFGRARALARESLTYRGSLRDGPVTAMNLVGLAAVYARTGDEALAAVLVGAAENQRGVPDLGDADLLDLVARLQEVLGEEEYAARFAHGRGLALPELLDELGIDPGVMSGP
jgi:predicted ATPase/DNA-binding SARP family transcriptional activator